ncbi:MAG: bifunctional UDP-N-acetylmuramoyl-tripeptide:D-alanyl-D-alanine ligase/alanine racemase [Bacteroidia bacterium]
MLGTPYDIRQIAEAALARDLFQGESQPQPLRYVSFDTRTLSHGRDTVFVALRTAHNDGHDFIPQALALGVRNFIVDRPLSYPGINYALCDDTLSALQHWAMLHRQRFACPVVGITGSNGKTTVKEWLATLLEGRFQLVKSPMSYNSQLGVALSLLRIHPQADLALIEAGISQQGEMALLHEMIRPTVGIFTHLGEAHADGFASRADKLAEKLLLFGEVEQVLALSYQPEVTEALVAAGCPLRLAGADGPDLHLRLVSVRDQGDTEVLSLTAGAETFEAVIPALGPASRHNALLALLAARSLGLETEAILQRLPLLYPVEMRSEMITDNPEITLINDSYNSDPDSIRNALHLLRRTKGHSRRQVILSDVAHLGDQQEAVQRQLLAEAIEVAGADQVRTVGPVFARIEHSLRYPTTGALLDAIRYEDFVGSTVLLKGARAYQFERIIPLLNRKPNATWFQIRLDDLAHNVRLLKGLLPPGTHLMCMVKAFSYGSGSWEIAQELEKLGVSYLAVAYASEAIELRQAGIALPIMVMNPDPVSLDLLLRYDAEPEIGNLDLLRRYLRAARMSGARTWRIHLKLETGMGRLGFRSEDIDSLIACIADHPDLEVVSVLTHLAAADDPGEDAFTHGQVQRFGEMYARLQQGLGIYAWRHVLNTSGGLRFPQYAMDMVRLGIGLYGVDPVAGAAVQPPLHEIGALYSSISHLQDWPAGSSIGYGRAQVATRDTRIATVAAGYADGIPRSLGLGRAAFLVRGQRAATFGRVCMDMLMLDVTDIHGVQVGDEVCIFGRQGEAFLSVQELAHAAGTIPYELLVHIGPRVRRVYTRE